MISLSFLIAVPLFIAASQSPQEQLSSSLRCERIEQIRAGYLNASEERRAAALELFSGLRSAANPTGGSLGFKELDALVEVLAPTASELLTVAQGLARAIDLRVTPGAFESRVEGMGEAMTVHLTRRSAALPEGDSVVSLYWVAPDGTESRARSEMIPAGAFAAGSFEMFIRPPVSEPGSWELVCDVGLGEDVGRSRSVGVECLNELNARREALKNLPRQELSGWTPLKALEALCVRGIRHPVLGASELLELAERGSSGALTAVRLESGLEFHLADSPQAKGSLVIAGGSTYSPLELAAGVCGEAWERFAESEQLRVIFIDLPLVAKGGRPSMAMRLREIHDEHPDEALHLVAFGDAAGFIPSMRVRHPDIPLGSVTLVSDSIRRSGRDPRLDVRAMMVECSGSAPEQLWTREVDFGSVLIKEPFILAALYVPELMLVWNHSK